jgi:hypothetical protein
MKTVTTIGIDLAKNSFAVYGVNAKGKPILSRTFNCVRGGVLLVTTPDNKNWKVCSAFPLLAGTGTGVTTAGSREEGRNPASAEDADAVIDCLKWASSGLAVNSVYDI